MSNNIQKNERNLQMFCHLGGFAGYVFPFGNNPLTIRFIKESREKRRPHSE